MISNGCAICLTLFLVLNHSVCFLCIAVEYFKLSSYQNIQPSSYPAKELIFAKPIWAILFRYLLPWGWQIEGKVTKLVWKNTQICASLWGLSTFRDRHVARKFAQSCIWSIHWKISKSLTEPRSLLYYLACCIISINTSIIFTIIILKSLLDQVIQRMLYYIFKCMHWWCQVNTLDSMLSLLFTGYFDPTITMSHKYNK